MTHSELQQLIADVQKRQSELANVEVQAARRGTPRRLFEPFSAFANRTGGQYDPHRCLLGDRATDCGISAGRDGTSSLWRDAPQMYLRRLEPEIWSRLLRRQSGEHAPILPRLPAREDIRDSVSEIGVEGTIRVMAAEYKTVLPDEEMLARELEHTRKVLNRRIHRTQLQEKSLEAKGK